MRVNLRKLNLALAVVVILLLATWWWGLPYLNRARETGSRIRCNSLMAQMYKAMQLYAADNQGMFPGELTDLLSQDLTPEVFTCPSGRDFRAEGRDAVEIARNIRAKGLPLGLYEQPPEGGRHCSFIYKGKGLKFPAAASDVILYEPLVNHDGDGCWVLFGNGHVEFVERKRIESVIHEP